MVASEATAKTSVPPLPQTAVKCGPPGRGETVIAPVPLCPSLVAVIVTGPPAETPVTNPVGFTVATAVLLLVHITRRPVRTFPTASFVVAVSCTDPPGAIVAVAGVTVTEATGGVAPPPDPTSVARVSTQVVPLSPGDPTVVSLRLAAWSAPVAVAVGGPPLVASSAQVAAPPNPLAFDSTQTSVGWQALARQPPKMVIRSPTGS